MRNSHRLKRSYLFSSTLPSERVDGRLPKDLYIESGWGKLIFAHTFQSNKRLLSILRDEDQGKRNIAFYVQDPQILNMESPNIFLDPSYTYRLHHYDYYHSKKIYKKFQIRYLNSIEDGEAINRIYREFGMIEVEPERLLQLVKRRGVDIYIAEDMDGNIIGTVMGLNHSQLFNDPEMGASFWSLAVTEKTKLRGVGTTLIRYVAERYFTTNCQYIDLSVLYNNRKAISLYKKLGFKKVPIFTVKNRNSYNTTLLRKVKMNIYTKIIIDELRRRGLEFEILSEQKYRVNIGGKEIDGFESLTSLTSQRVIELVSDKIKCNTILREAGVKTPHSTIFINIELAKRFLEEYKEIVVKPNNSEQGLGISVRIKTLQDLENAIKKAKNFSDEVILEEYIRGDEYRVLVIDREVVAISKKIPAFIIGDGKHTIKDLIDIKNIKLSKETGGESKIEIDSETERLLRDRELELNSTIKDGERVQLKEVANLHKGGEFVNSMELDVKFKEMAIRASEITGLDISGVDLMIQNGEGYIIELNERPGLANHEPFPTAEKFVDYLIRRG